MTLVELMVGLAIGMLLVAGLALMFGNSSRSNAELEKSVRHIENGRQAVDLLTEDISLAGYYGTVPLSDSAALPSGTGCASLTTATLLADLTAMQSAANPTVPFGVVGLTPADASGMSACLPNYRAGTPALIVRRVDTATTAVASVIPGTLYIQTSHYSPDNYSSYIAGTSGGTFTLKATSTTLNPVRRFIYRIYYLADCNECSPSDGIPTLKRRELRGASWVTLPIAEGIEQIGFDYGYDTNSDGNVDQWYGLSRGSGNPEALVANGTTPLGATTLRWSQVIAVRLAVISRTTEPSAGYVDTRSYQSGLKGTAQTTWTSADWGGSANDSYKRRGYSAVVRLNTVAGFRDK